MSMKISGNIKATDENIMLLKELLITTLNKS